MTLCPNCRSHQPCHELELAVPVLVQVRCLTCGQSFLAPRTGLDPPSDPGEAALMILAQLDKVLALWKPLLKENPDA